MREPVTSAAPVASRATRSTTTRRVLRLRRFFANASWVPLVLLWLPMAALSGTVDSIAALVFLIALALIWPVVVITNAMRSRPPRLAAPLLWILGLFNLVVLVPSAFMSVMLAIEFHRAGANVVAVGAIATLLLFIGVLLGKRQPTPVPFLAAGVAAMGMVFFATALAVTVDERPWLRLLPPTVVAPPSPLPITAEAPPPVLTPLPAPRLHEDAQGFSRD